MTECLVIIRQKKDHRKVVFLLKWEPRPGKGSVLLYSGHPALHPSRASLRLFKFVPDDICRRRVEVELSGALLLPLERYELCECPDNPLRDG